MCGLIGLWCQQSVPDLKYIDKMFQYAEKRGRDGVGVVISDCYGDGHQFKKFKSIKPYSECQSEILDFIKENLHVGDTLLGICRSQPETEPSTTIKNMQPIVSEDGSVALIHNGAISNKIHNELKEWTKKEACYDFVSDIDSESILASYYKHDFNIKEAMEYISGGVACLMVDMTKHCLYVICDHQPISHCYIKGDIGCYFLTSDCECLREIVKESCGTTHDGVAVWEQWYAHPLRGHRIKCIDLGSGFISTQKYKPRFITNNWDSRNPKGDKQDETLTLVAASSGLDSSITLAMLKKSGYDNIIACHYKYGHRGQICEEIAIKKICEKLDIPLKIFDIEKQMSEIDKTSMLMDKNSKIITGTDEGLKTVAAWTPCRNVQFLTWMATYAESLVIEYGYKEVQLMGGFLQLTESGVYGDNSENFVSSFMEMLKYGSLIGDRIKINYGLSDLMKSDQFYIIKKFGLEDIYKYTISCDRPKLCINVDGKIIDPYEIMTKEKWQKYENGESILEPPGYWVPCNCSKGGLPACGSGSLSYWASKMVGMDDMKIRNFYDVDDKDYKLFTPPHLKEEKIVKKNIHNIIDRIHFPKDKLEKLHLILTGEDD